MSAKDVKNQLGTKRALKRRWVTWVRMLRYGVNNFSRNAWLTTAATAVMTITLLIILTAFTARIVLGTTVQEIRQKVDIPINLRTDVTKDEIKKVEDKFRSLSTVSNVRLTTLDESKQQYIDANNPTAEYLQIISELPTSPFFPVLHVVLQNANDTAEIVKLVAEDKDVRNALHPDPRRAPVFTGEKKKVIDTISSWATFAEKGGLAVGGIFVAISMLIIFNTIRMAIFNRRDEIEMMKLIGADKAFIRGPFVVEAVMYGFIAALLATAIGILIFLVVEPRMSSFFGGATASLRTSIIDYAPLLLLAMIAIGSFIGVVSSRLAVRRYLKI